MGVTERVLGPDTLKELGEWAKDVFDWNDRTDVDLPGVLAHATQWEQERSDAAALRELIRQHLAERVIWPPEDPIDISMARHISFRPTENEDGAEG